MRAYQEKTAPIIFLIHVLDGVLDELEIFTADSSKIEQELINLQNVDYVVITAIKRCCMLSLERKMSKKLVRIWISNSNGLLFFYQAYYFHQNK